MPKKKSEHYVNNCAIAGAISEEYRKITRIILVLSDSERADFIEWSEYNYEQ